MIKELSNMIESLIMVPPPDSLAVVKERMDRAQNDLLAYAERPKSELADPTKHKRLIADLKQAMDEYLTAISKLGQ